MTVTQEYTDITGAAREVSIREDGKLWQDVFPLLTATTTTAVLQLAQKLRDAELGRWRDPDEPGFVVYPLRGGAARVVREEDGYSVTCSSRREAERSRYVVQTATIASRYYEAQEPPKPTLTEQYLALAPGQRFGFTHTDVEYTKIDDRYFVMHHEDEEKYEPSVRAWEVYATVRGGDIRTIDTKED